MIAESLKMNASLKSLDLGGTLDALLLCSFLIGNQIQMAVPEIGKTLEVNSCLTHIVFPSI